MNNLENGIINETMRQPKQLKTQQNRKKKFPLLLNNQSLSKRAYLEEADKSQSVFGLKYFFFFSMLFIKSLKEIL